LSGGAGDDILTGGVGADASIGGLGSNTYVYNTGDAATGETITFNTTSGAIETISVVTTTDLSKINGGALLTGLDAITLTAGQDATVLGSQITGLSVALNGAAGDNFTINGTSGNDTISLANATMRAGTATVISTLAGNDNITGSTLVDTITGGTGVDTITGGTGNDVFVFAAGDSGITLATADTITDFTAGDTLSLGLAGSVAADATNNYTEAVAAVASFAAALVAANNALAVLNGNGVTTAANLYNFQFDTTNGYLFIDNTSDGVADQVVVLTGITTAAGFAATAIVA
jgi:Ca2+-binding RTX toxin-like protein